VLRDVVNNYSANGFPLDTIWSDIDYLANYRDFHYDDQNGFKDQPDFVRNTLHN
jgi:alpha-glucosidase (family GH31 glycosyl hydrolase)